MTDATHGAPGEAPAAVGAAVGPVTKKALATDIAVALGITPPAVSFGSSVASEFIGRVYTACTGEPLDEGLVYRRAERLMQALSLTYDPFWDTSEHRGQTGGGTVTNRAFSRIRTAITGRPRCFILNVTDAPIGDKYETDHETSYGFSSKVSGRAPLLDAGPGSRVLYYTTSSASRDAMHFTAHARVAYIHPGWEGEEKPDGSRSWLATIQDFEAFESPVPKSRAAIDGWNSQHGIAEITFETYAWLVVQGTGQQPPSEGQQDSGGDIIAQQILESFPVEDDADVELVPGDALPDVMPSGQLSPLGAFTRDYASGRPASGNIPGALGDLPPRTPSQRRRDKLAEVRAVQIATKFLADRDWTLASDHQASGDGFDLRFASGARTLNVEVKGVQGSELAFNLTPKEWWRAQTDPLFVVLAVTSVLSPRKYFVNVVTRDRLMTARREILSYRLSFGD